MVITEHPEVLCLRIIYAILEAELLVGNLLGFELDVLFGNGIEGQFFARDKLHAGKPPELTVHEFGNDAAEHTGVNDLGHARYLLGTILICTGTSLLEKQVLIQHLVDAFLYDAGQVAVQYHILIEIEEAGLIGVVDRLGGYEGCAPGEDVFRRTIYCADDGLIGDHNITDGH